METAKSLFPGVAAGQVIEKLEAAALHERRLTWSWTWIVRRVGPGPRGDMWKIELTPQRNPTKYVRDLLEARKQEEAAERQGGEEYHSEIVGLLKQIARGVDELVAKMEIVKGAEAKK